MVLGTSIEKDRLKSRIVKNLAIEKLILSLVKKQKMNLFC